ncbi:MAG: glycosyltransferase [Chitinispirillales bacterium]|jgi:glycosyltransferase involved in cell wall biosynthesis|nr:glycosyltransferase [Chitinispirillales bacterium]
MKVSIILPTYNGTQYIADSINSCLNQTYKNIELIIVDDGSTNNVCEIVETFVKQDSRVRLLKHDKNQKLPAALNTGFSEAKGEYFTWTSDDNQYKENAIERMVSCITSHKDADIVYADYDMVNEDGNVFYCEKGLPERLLVGNTIGACFLYKNTVHHRLNGFNTNRFLLEDLDFWIRAYEHFNFKKMNENLYIYRWHNKSLTVTRRIDVYRGTMDFILEEAEKHKRFSNETKIEAYLQALTFATIIQDSKKRKFALRKIEILIEEAVPMIESKRIAAEQFILKTTHGNSCKLCIFCVGVYGLKLYYLLNILNIKVDFFADNDSIKHCKDIMNGIRCLSFAELSEIKDNTLIIVAHAQPDTIIEQLSDADCPFVMTKQELQLWINM